MPTMLPHGVGAEQQISQIAKCCVKHIIEQREIDSYILFLAGIENDTRHREYSEFNEDRENSIATLPIFSKNVNGQWLIANGLMYRAKRDTCPPSCASASRCEGFCPSDRRGATRRELSLGASPGVPLRHISGHYHARSRCR